MDKTKQTETRRKRKNRRPKSAVFSNFYFFTQSASFRTLHALKHLVEIKGVAYRLCATALLPDVVAG